MNKIKYSLSLLALFLCFLTSFSEGPALGQPVYVGEVCVEFFGEMHGRPPMRLHVLSHGADTYQLVGKMPDGGGHFMPVHGAAVLEGNNLLKMTLKGAAAGVYAVTYSFGIDLNMDRDNGSITALQTSQSVAPSLGEPEFVTAISGGGFRFSQCP